MAVLRQHVAVALKVVALTLVALLTSQLIRNVC